jgi:hypothetical protein
VNDKTKGRYGFILVIFGSTSAGLKPLKNVHGVENGSQEKLSHAEDGAKPD